MEVPVLLIEFEGVLADTAALRHAALVETLAADGIALVDEHDALIAGRTMEDAIRRVRESVGASDDPTAVEIARLRAERPIRERTDRRSPAGVSIRVALKFEKSRRLKPRSAPISALVGVRPR